MKTKSRPDCGGMFLNCTWSGNGKSSRWFLPRDRMDLSIARDSAGGTRKVGSGVPGGPSHSSDSESGQPGCRIDGLDFGARDPVIGSFEFLVRTR